MQRNRKVLQKAIGIEKAKTQGQVKTRRLWHIQGAKKRRINKEGRSRQGPNHVGFGGLGKHMDLMPRGMQDSTEGSGIVRIYVLKSSI